MMQLSKFGIQLVRNVIVAWLLCTTGVLLLPLLSLTLLIKGSFERAKNWVQGSFERAKNWVQELQVQGNPNMVMALAGNKADLLDARKVSPELARFLRCTSDPDSLIHHLQWLVGYFRS